MCQNTTSFGKLLHCRPNVALCRDVKFSCDAGWHFVEEWNSAAPTLKLTQLVHSHTSHNTNVCVPSDWFLILWCQLVATIPHMCGGLLKLGFSWSAIAGLKYSINSQGKKRAWPDMSHVRHLQKKAGHDGADTYVELYTIHPQYTTRRFMLAIFLFPDLLNSSIAKYLQHIFGAMLCISLLSRPLSCWI